MTITAKFRSSCLKCQGLITPGTRIEYEKGKGSWHIKCPGTSTASAPASASAADKPRTYSFDLTQESEGTPPPAPGVVLNSAYLGEQPTWLVDGARVKGDFWRGLGLEANFYSRDFLDDQDWFQAKVGWRVSGSADDIRAKLTGAGHHVTFYTLADQRAAREAARIAKAAKEAEAKAAREAAVQARKDFDAEVARLTDGLHRVGCDWDYVSYTDPKSPAIASWRDGSDYRDLIPGVSKVTGQPAYLHPHGGYDDHRMDAYVDTPTRDTMYTANMQRYGTTPAAAREWLTKYSGCVGAEYYTWVAAQPEPSASASEVLGPNTQEVK